MANGILKGLAVAAGTGLAMGFTSGRVRVRSAPYRPVPPVDYAQSPVASPLPADHVDDDFLNIEPLLDRLERIEARIESMGQPAATSSRFPDHLAESIADLERRVEENTRELAILREHITDAERRASESTASLHLKVEETRAELPAIVEQHVTARVDDLRTRFAAEIEESHRRTLEVFERTIDEKISSRIGSIERALTEQAGAIDALGVRATETDNNLQRLVAAIEKLCERAQLMVPVSEPLRNETPLAFEAQMDDAMRREPVVPVLRTSEPVADVKVPAPAFAAPAPKKSRFFGGLLAAAFSLLASRLMR